MIPLTYEQYWTAAFIFFQFGLFYTAKNLFPFPDEVDSGTDSYY